MRLHARGRRAGEIAWGLLGVAIACWALAAFVADTAKLVQVLGPLAAVSVLGFGLGGHDPALERTTPQPWPRWRAAELGLCAIAAIAVLAPALLQADQHPAAALRNLAGLGGLTALGCVALGARLAWLAPAAWAFAGSAVGPRAEDWLVALTWPVQAADARTALVLAAVLAAAGAVVHTRIGSRAGNEEAS